ncbi:MAG: hypothetical protein K2J08_07420 [Ruminococcus sp.]|nr:hypothetical protein [Ruminococcus sp.]
MKKIFTVLFSGVILFTLVSKNSPTPEISAENHYEITEEIFEQNPDGYHRNIALIASALSEASYNGYVEVNSTYEDFGFDVENDVTLFSYSGAENNADYDTNIIDYEEDSLAFSVATREIGKKRLLAVTLRGTNLNSTNDIIHDISIFGSPFFEDNSPTGFLSFFKKVSVGLSLYIGEHPEIAESAEDGSLKILITGHSLGGAGSNLLGAYLDSHGNNDYSGFDGNSAVQSMYSEILDIPQDDIFVYTFACPNVYYGDPTTADFDNIINVINESDLIPQVPSGSKFGQFVYFDTQEENGLMAHYGYKYMNAVDVEIPDGVRYYGGGIDAVLTDRTFSGNSAEYHQEIAEVAVALSSASYNGRREAGYYINSAYRQLGFKSQNIAVYGYPSEDFSFSFANGSFGGITLLAITLKGNSGQSDFYSEINSDFEQPFRNGMTNRNYYNFYLTVRDTLADYLSEHNEVAKACAEGKLKILISGHSIGGAASQLLALDFNSPDSPLKIAPEDVFVYTFGCPYVFGEYNDIECRNIINIINENDFVTLMPFGKRLGKTFSFNTGDFGKKNYEPKIYAEAVTDGEVKDGYSPYRKITVNNPYAEIEVLKNGELMGKNEIKTFSDDTQLHIFLPSDEDYSVRLSGVQQEIVALTAESSETGEKSKISYENIRLFDNKVVEYRMEKNKNIDKCGLFVLDENDKPVYIIATDGTEMEYKEKSSAETRPLVLGGISAIAVATLATALVFSTKKKHDEN